MGSIFEINDTLQITKEQGFPKELDLEKHLQKEFSEKEFEEKVFDFRDKPKLRNYQVPPVRVFLAENINEKWLYWGRAEIVEIKHDYLNNTTSGKFRITKIFTVEEMKNAEKVLNNDRGLGYFENLKKTTS